MKPDPKPGQYTTEFWLSAAAAVVGALLAADIFPADHWAMKVAGVLGMALAAMGYSISRGQAKS